MFQNVQIEINDLTNIENQISLKHGKLKIEEQRLIWFNEQKEIKLPYNNITSAGVSINKVILLINGCEDLNIEEIEPFVDGNYQIILISENSQQIYEQINIIFSQLQENNDIFINNDSIENNYIQDNMDQIDIVWQHDQKFEDLINNQNIIFYDDQKQEISDL